MRRFSLIPLLVVLGLAMAGCTTSAAQPTDTASQPDPAIGTDQMADPTSSDAELQAAAIQCLAGPIITSRPLRIVTTVAPITSLVGIMAGNIGHTVQGLVPEGTNSHTFEPPPSAAQILEQADIVFMNGLQLEDPTKAMAKSNAKKAVLCELGTATLPASDWLYDFSFPKEGGKPNPHLWTNPPMVLGYLTMIRDVLIGADPLNATKYDENYVALSQDVMVLDEAMKKAVETIPAPNRQLLTYHDAYAYFSRYYGFKVIGAIQPQSFEEPSPKEVAALIEQVKANKVPAIFGSEVFPSAVLATIGKEANVSYVNVLRDDDLPDKPGSMDHSWAGLMRFNFVTIVSALGGDSRALSELKFKTAVLDKATYPQ